MTSAERVKAELCAGAFSGCLVEGDPQTIERERKIKRRAVAISVVLQTAALAVFVIAPLFAKQPELVGRYVVPVPSYGHHAVRQHTATTVRDRSHVHTGFFQPNHIPQQLSTGDRDDRLAEPGNVQIDISLIGPAGPLGLLNLSDRRPTPPDTDEARYVTRRISESHISPALLTQRVEPVFPALARQTRRSGRVELHALIGLNGSVQSLSVVSGDPLFINSALDAVKQWHYRPTYLNGQAVEVDTYITVIYSLQ